MIDCWSFVDDFGSLFGIIFSTFLQNVENAPDTTFSNSLAALRPSKTADFWMEFSLNLQVFSEPLPKSILRVSKCQFIHKSAVLDRFSVFQGSQNRPLGLHFRPKSRNFCWNRRTGRVLEPTWARFGAENAPRIHSYRHGYVFGRFGIDFWLILCG